MRVLIACGGTGGHLAPGIAIAQQLKELGHGATLAISRKSIDSEMAAAYGDLSFQRIPGSGFSLRPVALIKFAANAVRGFFAGLRLLRNGKYDLAIAFGGFSAIGVGIAAVVLRKPLYLHESNAKLGKAIRFLAPFARKVFIPPILKNCNPYVTKEKFQAMAYPLRRDFKLVGKEEARAMVAIPDFGKLLLIAGGSQGSRALTQWMSCNVQNLAELGFHCICLSGPGTVGGDSSVADAAGNVYVMRYLPFSHSMHLLYAAADMTICRAGAGTIAELVAAALPNILVPYPSSAGNHQLANALAMAGEGASKLVKQNQLEQLLAAIAELDDGATYHKMRENLIRLGEAGKDGAKLLSAAILGDYGAAK